MNRDRRDIDKVQRRTLGYWYIDGLTEIAAGCLCLLTGLLFFVEALAPPGSLPRSFTAIVLPALIIIGIFVAGRIVSAMKERLTYPRTGYVAYRQRKGVLRILTGLVAGIIGALGVGLLSILPGFQASLLPALEGVIIGAFLLYLAHTLGLIRFYVLAILSLLVGLAASLAGLGESLGLATYFSAMGIASIASGWLTLQSYLSRTRPSTEG